MRKWARGPVLIPPSLNAKMGFAVEGSTADKAITSRRTRRKKSFLRKREKKATLELFAPSFFAEANLNVSLAAFAWGWQGVQLSFCHSLFIGPLSSFCGRDQNRARRDLPLFNWDLDHRGGQCGKVCSLFRHTSKSIDELGTLFNSPMALMQSDNFCRSTVAITVLWPFQKWHTPCFWSRNKEKRRTLSDLSANDFPLLLLSCTVYTFFYLGGLPKK